MAVETHHTASAFLVDMFGASTVNPIFVASLANSDATKDARREGPRDTLTRSVGVIEGFVQRWDLSGRSTYFCVGTLRPDASTRSKATLAELNCLHVDLDFKSIAETPEQILKIITNLPLPPNYIIASGHGYHLYWLFKEGIPADPTAIAEIERRLKRLVEILAGDPACAEASRLMRLPGTHNSKNGERLEVAVIAQCAGRYDMAELDEWLDSVAAPYLHPKGAAKGNGSDPDPSAFDDLSRCWEDKAPIDVEAALAEMRHQHADPEHSVHRTQVRVSASLLSRGTAIDEVVTMVLEATRKVAGEAAAAWNWQAEERKIRGMCFSWLAKHPELGGDKEKADENAAPAEDLVKAFTFLGDAPATPPKMLMKGLIPAEGVAVTGGQSTAGKTFIEIYKAICLAKVLPFFGHKIVEKVGTVFVAAEGRAVIPNRFAAALDAAGIVDKLPIAWINRIPDFSSAAGIKLFVRQLKAMDERFRGDFGVRIGQVPIDTVAACFAMKDEDDNAEAQKVCNVLRAIGDEIGALMCPVHHYGKNPESGLRGASAWKGSADIVLGVLADIDPLSGRASDRELVCAKARDGEQGPISPFELEFVMLGQDEDGDPYGSCCVVPTEGQSRFDRTAKLSKGAKAIQDAITEALDSQGKMIAPRPDMGSILAAKVPDVRVEFDRRYVVDEVNPAKAAEAKRKAFKRALDHLSPTQFGAGSAEGADWIWRAQK
jgi:AAA domain